MRQVDIIMPVHNRWEHTKQSLDSLMANTDPKLYNLYVIDDASDGEVLKNLEHYSMQAPISVAFNLHVQKMNVGPAVTRNEECNFITRNKIRSRYLYHSDNDVYFTKGWLETLINTYEFLDRFDVKLLGGGCHPYLQNNSVINLDPNGPTIGIKDAVSGYSQFMSWQIWDEFGPFDEGSRGQDIKIMGSEDWAFCQRMIKAGLKVGSIEPEVVIATGKTNTYGNPATGSETFKNVEGVTIK